MASHTIGDWRFEKIKTFPFGIRIVAAGNSILNQTAVCHSSKQKTVEDNEAGLGFDGRCHSITQDEAAAMIAEQDANGRLMAAAPELLEACKEARIVLEREGFGITAGFCQDAILKAEGRDQ